MINTFLDKIRAGFNRKLFKKTPHGSAAKQKSLKYFDRSA
jgi:hypothetical protein